MDDFRVEVLVVDDERINLVLMEGILKDLDLEVVRAASGAEALALMPRHDFALVLLDVMMPGMDGFAIAEHIRSNQRTQHVPIIFITAISKEQRHVFRGYEKGAVDYLFKPVEPAILKSKVRVFVELHKKHRELEHTAERLERTVEELEAHRQALEGSEQRYRTVADHTHDWEGWIGPDGELLYCSPSCERITGYPPSAFEEQPDFMAEILHADDVDAWRTFMNSCGIDGRDSMDLRIFRADGQMRWLSQVNRNVTGHGGEPLGVRFSMRDVTARKEMELQLRHQALHDPLTHTANRTLCLDRIDRLIKRSRDTGHWDFAVVFMDLDRFKVINDSHGHAFGDRLLVEVSHRLEGCVRSGDTVARFGGDEFVLVLEDVAAPREAVRVAKHVRQDLGRPFRLEGHEVQTSASMGIALGDPECADADRLLQNANIAMYRAKDTGKDRFHLFNRRMFEEVVGQTRLENDMRRALQEGGFYLQFQPIVALNGNGGDPVGLYGFEALVRWNHPEHGPLSPGRFIPMAEDSGLIVPLGQWVLEESCRIMRAWRDESPGFRSLVLSVNLSPVQFARKDLVDVTKDTLRRYGLPPDALKLEITETAIMDNIVHSVRRLEQLKDSGIRLSIDDFGTGYSSMSMLQQFPLDSLKVDLSFVRRMEEDARHVEIVRAIVTLAHSLGLDVVAEGIEKPTQAEALAGMGCEFGQGYLYARPLDADAARDYARDMARSMAEGVSPAGTGSA